MRVFGYAVFAILSFLLLLEVNEIIRGYRARNWKRCKGKLTQWKVNTEMGSESTTIDVEHIVYSYRVGDNEYENNRLGFGAPRSGPPIVMERLLDEIFVKAPEVNVFYDPNQPQESALCVGLQRYHALGLFTYGIFLAFIGAFLYAEH